MKIKVEVGKNPLDSMFEIFIRCGFNKENGFILEWGYWYINVYKA